MSRGIYQKYLNFKKVRKRQLNLNRKQLVVFGLCLSITINIGLILGFFYFSDKVDERIELGAPVYGVGVIRGYSDIETGITYFTINCIENIRLLIGSGLSNRYETLEGKKVIFRGIIAHRFIGVYGHLALDEENRYIEELSLRFLIVNFIKYFIISVILFTIFWGILGLFTNLLQYLIVKRKDIDMKRVTARRANSKILRKKLDRI